MSKVKVVCDENSMVEKYKDISKDTLKEYILKNNNVDSDTYNRMLRKYASNVFDKILNDLK